PITAESHVQTENAGYWHFSSSRAVTLTAREERRAGDTDDQCGPRSATCQCSSMLQTSAHQMPHIQCPSELPFNV
ncbi:unnamed protein product, partial [Staurois parvus]